MKWEDIKGKVYERMCDRLEELGIKGKFTLIDGMFSHYYSSEFHTGMLVSGPNVPAVMIVENDTGKIHWFALKALLKKGEYHDN